ncbi:MAG: alpha/beta hydrolase [Chloroflexi bacterium]|nr:alpha/beta hydrolase [Chloroflexota bacterium]
MRRILLLAAAPVFAAGARGPVLDRLARRMMQAPRRLPGEAGLAPALDRLGGEVVRLRSRDGLRLVARWLPADPPAGPGSADADVAGGWVPDPREAILLLHGYNGSVAPDLVEVGPFLRRTAGVLGLDFRGHGASDDGPTTFGMLEVEDVAGALAFLGERGVRRVALVGSSMGGITAIAAVAVLGDGRLAAADANAAAPAASIEAPTPRIVAVVADSVTPELAVVVGNRLGLPFGRRIAERAFGRFDHLIGGDPRATQPIATVGLLEDVPLLLVHGAQDRTVPIYDARRLAAAAPPGTRHLVISGADHGAGHATDPAVYEAAVEELLREAFTGARR